MSNLTYITNDLAIKDETIIRHWSTGDQDEQGYLVQNGTQRTLCEGQCESGEWILFADTNGDPVALYEGGGDEFIDLLTDDNGDQTKTEVVGLILGSIKDADLKDWAEGVLCV